MLNIFISINNLLLENYGIICYIVNKGQPLKTIIRLFSNLAV